VRESLQALGSVLLPGDDIDRDGHKAVIDAAELATLAEEGAGSGGAQANLIEAAWTGVDLYAKCWDGSAMDNVGGGNNETKVGSNGKEKTIIDFEKTKPTARQVAF
jgi:hypothetical protein